MQIDKKIESYTGGYFQTNAYVLDAPGGLLMIDAPEGSLRWLQQRGRRIAALLLTHAHIDHIHDAAAIVRECGCPIYHHPDGIPLLEDRMAYRRFGLSIDFEPITGGELIYETPAAEFAGLTFQIFHTPGHCPGSLCFYDAPAKTLFAGDTLFAGSIGRTDLPGGNHAELLAAIRNKLLTLPDDVMVLPGHGPATTIGAERRGNPFLS